MGCGFCWGRNPNLQFMQRIKPTQTLTLREKNYRAFFCYNFIMNKNISDKVINRLTLYHCILTDFIDQVNKSLNFYTSTIHRSEKTLIFLTIQENHASDTLLKNLKFLSKKLWGLKKLKKLSLSVREISELLLQITEISQITG